MQKPFIVGITGGSGSGKTYFINQLCTHFKEEEICLVSQDNYYRPIVQVPLDENGVQNFDTLEAIDFNAFRKDISKLINGESLQIKEYTFNNKDKTPQTFVLHPAPLIIIEGIFVFVNKLINEVLNFKVFMDAREEIKLKRRITRDYNERGYDIDDVLYRYENHVSPAYQKYIEPEKHKSDVTIPNNTNIDLATFAIATFLKSQIVYRS